MARRHLLEGLMKWARREPWRDRFDAVLEDHLLPTCDETSLEVDEIVSTLGEELFVSTVWASAFEDLLTREFDDGSNIVDEYLKRRGWKETESVRAYITALRNSAVSLYEVSDDGALLLGSVELDGRALVLSVNSLERSEPGSEVHDTRSARRATLGRDGNRRANIGVTRCGCAATGRSFRARAARHRSRNHGPALSRYARSACPGARKQIAARRGQDRKRARESRRLAQNDGKLHRQGRTVRQCDGELQLPLDVDGTRHRRTEAIDRQLAPSLQVNGSAQRSVRRL